MPTYRWCCTVDHSTEEFPDPKARTEWDAWQSIKDDSVPDCPDCGQRAIKVFVPPGLYGISKQAYTRHFDATEKAWDKDRPAYKRLRMEGMQPPHVDGAARLEQAASNDLEVNTGLRYGPIHEREVKEAVTLARESGWIPKVSV